jgi:hypothetical protein
MIETPIVIVKARIVAAKILGQPHQFTLNQVPDPCVP